MSWVEIKKTDAENSGTGKRDNASKIPLELIPWDSVIGIARVLQFGATKYGRRNWEKGLKWNAQCAGSGLRHLLWWLLGEETDIESGLPHLDHFACNALMLAALVRRKVGVDDRATVSKEVLMMLAAAIPGMTKKDAP